MCSCVHKIFLSGQDLQEDILRIVAPVVVIPDILSKNASLRLKSCEDSKKGKLPKIATINQANDEKRKVCLKFSLNSFSRLANTNKTPINIVTNEADMKLWPPSFKITCKAYGANIDPPKTINNIPIKKKTVLFVAIKIKII